MTLRGTGLFYANYNNYNMGLPQVGSRSSLSSSPAITESRPCSTGQRIPAEFLEVAELSLLPAQRLYGTVVIPDTKCSKAAELHHRAAFADDFAISASTSPARAATSRTSSS
jgi:hypothetical protein